MAVILSGKVAQFLLALAMMRAATTLLLPEEMGRVSLVLATIAFFALFLVSPVGTFINRRLHGWQTNGTARYYLIRYVSYLLVVALVAAIALFFFHMMGAADFGISVGWLVFLVCGSLVFNTINQTAIPSLNLLGDSGKFVLLSVATIAASFACAVLLVQMVQPSAQYWLLGLLVGQAFAGMVGARVLFSRLPRTEIPGTRRVILKRHGQALFGFAWPVAVAAGLGWVQGQGYRYLMEEQLGLAQLGLFVAGYGVSMGIIAGFESVITTYFLPRLFRDVSASNTTSQAQAWKSYAAAVIPSLLLTSAFIVMLAPELTRIFLGEEFQSSADYVIWGALAEATRVLVGVYTLIAHVYMRTRWLIVPNLVGAMLSIMLCVLFIPYFGAEGVGAGLVLSGFAMVAMMHVLLVRRVGGSGTRFSAILAAGVSAAALWGVTLGLRHFLNPSGWGAIAGIVALIGAAYLILQYALLRGHLEDKRPEGLSAARQ